MNFSLNDRIVLVTGAARGIGAAVAQRLAAAGGTVYLADLQLDHAAAKAREILAEGGKAHAVEMNVCDPSSWSRVVETIESASGALDVLVNNVGITIAKSIEDTTLEDWRLMMQVNLEGPFIGTKATLPLMKKSALRTPYGGSIVNMSSVSGIVGTANLSCYTSTKAGLRYFSKSAALEFARAGYKLRVNTIHPGLTEGPSAQILFESTVNSGVCRDLEEAQQMWTRRYPLNRMAQPKDIAAGVLFLASDESNFMTGTELIMDGGLTA
jgi:3(or 17)beta-hydroxysteroid dehydrogenase